MKIQKRKKQFLFCYIFFITVILLIIYFKIIFCYYFCYYIYIEKIFMYRSFNLVYNIMLCVSFFIRSQITVLLFFKSLTSFLSIKKLRYFGVFPLARNELNMQLVRLFYRRTSFYVLENVSL